MSERGILGTVATGIIALIIVIGVFIFVERVPEGRTAVVYSPSGGAVKTLDPGWHLIGLFEKTQQYPTRITIVKDKVTVTTKDGKVVSMPASYEMRVDRNKVLDIFKELGSQNVEQIQEGYLYQRLFRASREVVSNYTVLDIYGTGTNEASSKITEKMAEESEELGFIITNVVLGTPELDEETEKAINERVKAAQQLEKLELEKQIAEEEAERKRIEAEGQATAEIEKAKGKAEANEIIAKSITPEILEMEELKARKKHGWITIQGHNGIIVDGKDDKKKDKK